MKFSKFPLYPGAFQNILEQIMWKNKGKGSDAVKKQDFKKWTFGLAGGFVVIAGALASCFYLTYGELDSRLAEANAKLLNPSLGFSTTILLG